MPPTTRGRPRHGKSKKKNNKKRHTSVDVNIHNYTKRPRVANVLLENEMLIDEIRTRKALWQRTHEQHHSSTLTAPLWDEVAKILDSTSDNIRRRWKSLKDHYRRELKKSMTDATAPPSAWPYYKKMRFMKSQMFVSLRRKNGEDHLEILSDDEEEINNQWNGQGARKQECGSDTIDGYEVSDEYNEMVKFEQHMQTHDDIDATQEDEEEEDDERPQEEEEQTEEMQEEQEQSVIPPMQDDRLSTMQQQTEMPELTSIANIRQQPVITSDMRATDLVGLPNIVTTTASSLSNRLSGIQQRAAEIVQQSERLSSLQQQDDMNGHLEDMNTRHNTLQEQHAEINSRISAIQRNAEIAAIQQRANISAMHERAQMSVLQQRAEMQQRNGGVDNGVDNSNVSPITGDGSISDDYHFFMSLMPHVRHFTSLQKLKVRNRIQQIIIEEASNCQYDPLAN
ncbi:probable E3 ubiquitin-protein ligase bre1 isoform X2 [Phymastichus coffea]|nr:probable E3 ubiquitin-protein ligase bre1 isoform X2 [Phymastichus coffea]